MLKTFKKTLSFISKDVFDFFMKSELFHRFELQYFKFNKISFKTIKT